MSNVLTCDRTNSHLSAAARRCARAAALALFALGADGARAEGSRLASGTLSCNAPVVQSFVIGAAYAVACVYTPMQGPPENYVGDVRRVGIDLGFSHGAHITWTVVVGTDGKPETLSGTYVGVSAGAAPGVGLGANVLIGGSARTISLQPVSVELRAGLNLNVTVASLTLRRP